MTSHRSTNISLSINTGIQSVLGYHNRDDTLAARADPRPLLRAEETP